MGIKQLLKLNQSSVLGLDIGSSAVKVVQLLKNNDRYSVTGAAILDIPDDSDSSEQKEINTEKTIRQCIQTAGTQSQQVVCGVCGPEVAVRYFNFPMLPKEEVPGAVTLEASQVCPFSADDSAVDYQLFADDEDNICGFLVAATNKLIRSKSKLAKNASLKNVLMDVDGLALLNCYSEFETPQPGRATAILNVGNSYTNLAIMNDSRTPFIRDIAYAANDIITRIAEENNIAYEDIGKMLCTDDLNKSELDHAMENSFAQACQKLIVDVAETLRYYSTQEKSAVVEKVLVCGGFALVKGFVELLDSQLSPNVILWNPFENIQCQANSSCRDIIKERGPALAVAAGLAMRSI